MPQLRLALNQIDSTVGDLAGNADAIVHWTRHAAEQGAHLVAFPEMVLTGYPVEDLALRSSFVEALTRLADDVGEFLAGHGLRPDQVSSWVCHPGGPKVIDTIAEVLALKEHALDVTWDSLRRVGNLSSVSVLNVLQETIAHRRPGPGEPALLLALGPGFSAELVLLRW